MTTLQTEVHLTAVFTGMPSGQATPVFTGIPSGRQATPIFTGIPSGQVPAVFTGIPSVQHNAGPNAGAIAGGVVGGVAVVAIAVVAVFWIRRRYPRKQTEQFEHQPVMEQQHIAAPRVSQAPAYSSHDSTVGVTDGVMVKGDVKGDAEFEQWNEKDLKKKVKN